MRQISKRNAQFQQWESLISNRNKRQRAGEFLVQGVRSISQAIQHGWVSPFKIAQTGAFNPA